MSRPSQSVDLPKGIRFFLHSEDKALIALMDEELAKIEERLQTEASNTQPVADAVSRYLLSAGGKRVRPLLVLLAAQLGNGISSATETAAVSIELVHVATLYHDDVMDEADVRRGVESAHRRWNNNTAILAGDILFARASKLVARLDPRTVILQAETFERLCLGQLNETLGPTETDDPIEHYLKVLADKTGSLIASAGQIGAIEAGCDDATIAAIRDYGEHLGVAFQLADDVIDLRSPSEESGKTPGTDLREGVQTMPLLLLRKEAQQSAAAAEALARIQAGLADDETLRSAMAELAEHPVTQRTLDEARRYSALAKAAIKPLPTSSVKRALVRLADYIVDRTK